MKKTLLFGLLAGSAGLCLASAAAADNTSGMVGNTAVCTAPDGGVTKVYTDTAASYSIVLPGGQSMKGAVKDNGTQICYTQTDPATKDPPVCTPSVARKVGDTWDVQAQGSSQHCSLQAGKQ
jgi:hypothetical protein